MNLSKSQKKIPVHSKQFFLNTCKQLFLSLLFAGLFSSGFGQYHIFQSTDIPAHLNENDHDQSGGIEIGVKFQVTQDNGHITGIRFYKGSLDQGTHIGHLWTNTGTMLAEATFTNETGSGWQEVIFSSAIAVAKNVTYIASYYSSNGYYAYSNPGFDSRIVNGPLVALSDAESGGNGLYKYTGAPVFPTDNYETSNYFVDVVFDYTDVEAPSAPAICYAERTSTSITVTISGSTDNVGVSAYEVYLNNSSTPYTSFPYDPDPEHRYKIDNLSPSTSFIIQVKAKDVSGNPSPGSNSLQKSTLATYMLFDEGFEGNCPFAPFKNDQHCCSYSIQPESNSANFTAREGTSAARFEVNFSDPQTSGSIRAELEMPESYAGDEGIRWYGFSYYFKDWTVDGQPSHELQWHPNSSSGGAVLSLRTTDGHYKINNANDQTGDLIQPQDVVPNVWVDLVFNVKWATDNTGYIKVWKDGILIYQKENIATECCTGQYLKIGINAFGWVGNGQIDQVSKRVFYVDNVRIGNENASYCDVAPLLKVPTVSVVNNCGNSVLTASNYTGSLLWSNGATTPSITVTNAATYTVTQTVNGCTSAAASGIAAPKVVPLHPTVTVQNNCGNSTLTASNYAGSLLWSNGATTPSTTVTNAATYSVTQTVNGCSSQPGSATSAPFRVPPQGCVIIRKYSNGGHPPSGCAPGNITICQGVTAVLEVGNIPNDILLAHYYWNTGATSGRLDTNTPGAYSFTYSGYAGNCLSPPSNPLVITVTNCLGGKNISAVTDDEITQPAERDGSDIKLFPNPTKSYFTLYIPSSNKYPVSVSIFDVSGRVIEMHRQVASGTRLQMGNSWQPGTYFAEIQQGEVRKVIKLIKVN